MTLIIDNANIKELNNCRIRRLNLKKHILALNNLIN